jgi:acyl-CoA thioester hydrolase
MKIKINNEGRKIYVHTDKIRINDLNFGNHVGHQTVYEFCHDARIEYFEKMGEDLGLVVNEMNFGPYGLIMSQSAANYLAEIKHGMEINVEVYLESTHQCYFDLSYCLIDNSDQTELAKVLTTMACFDYKNKKVVPIPENIFSYLKNSLN